MNINDFLHLQIPISFYNRNEVWKIAKELIGKILVTHFNDELTVGRIIETEAYNGIYDKASHSYNGKRTSRNEIMYSTAGVSYVYICYGVHHLLNVVTNKENIPDAVLIRAIEPIVGFDIMAKRTNKKINDLSVTKGPGNLSKAFGITKNHSGISLTHHLQFLCDDGFKYKESEIISSPRIGVESAGKDALLPYRFFVKNNKYVSGKKNF
jgi:DNA-3-methyladenine glycosylase